MFLCQHDRSVKLNPAEHTSVLICNFKLISLLLHGTNSQPQSPPAALKCKAVKTLQRSRETQQSDDVHEQHLETVEGEGGAATCN